MYVILYVNSTKEDFIDELHKQNYKVIQLYTEKFFYPNWSLGELERAPFDKCKYKGSKECYVYKSILKANSKSDAVIVHVPNLVYMPSRSSYKRNRKQLWIFMTLESQHTYCSNHFNINDLDDWFNITATYKPQ